MSRSRSPSRDRNSKYKPDRPVFCGNFEYECEEREIIRLFEKYGTVERIDMKTGYAFVYMTDTRDGDDAIRKLDRMEYGYKRRPLRVEWAKQDENARKRETKPSTTLFVVNFDARRVTERDVERHFDPYGKLLRVEIKKNFAFVQYPDQTTATRALEATNGSRLLGRQIVVEYVERDGWGRDAGAMGGRDGGRSSSPGPYARGGGGGGGRRGRSRSRSRTPPPRRAPLPRSISRSLSPPRGRPIMRSRSPVRARRDRSPSYDR